MFTFIIYKPGIFINGLSPGLDMRGRKMPPNQTHTLMKIFRGTTYLRKEEVRQLAMSIKRYEKDNSELVLSHASQESRRGIVN